MSARPSQQDIARWLRLEVKHHRPGLAWTIAQLLIAGSKRHAFLDRPWVGALLRLAPRSRRRSFAIRLLALSPHYFIYQWNNRYERALTRDEILRREVERVAVSRKGICDRLLKPHLRPDMAVLDLGTGPGFLARELSGHVAQVIGCDVSRGVIACARWVNPAPNLTYVANPAESLVPLADASLDLVVSFAVLQHLTPEQSRALLGEIGRVLKPGGLALCHVIEEDPDEPRQWVVLPPRGWRERRTRPRMVFIRAPELTRELTRAGFADVSVRPIREIAVVDDDIQGDHLASFRRPRLVSTRSRS